MKKIYTLLLAATAVSLTANAQQLPNADFEGEWSACTPWTSSGNIKTEGQNPASWCISHVIGMSGMGAATLGNKTEGFNSTSAVQLKQVSTGFGSLKANVPAYLTLGTTWSTSKGSFSISNKDGGTFGGIEFAYRPDALSLVYKRSRGTDKPNEKSSVIAYMWKGSWTQASVPGAISATSPKTVDMVDRDRCVLGYSMDGTQGGAVTNNGGVLIASFINYITENAADWTKAVYDFDYKTTDTPEKINVIISAGDYFAGSDAVGLDNEMTVDDIKLVYYSRLNNLSVNGSPVEGFAPDTYEYSIDAAMPEESAISYTVKGNSGTAKASVSMDTENNKAVITVTNAHGQDLDGNSTHTYTLTFKAAEPPVQRTGNEFSGVLSIQLPETDPIVDDNAKVYIEVGEWPVATLKLYDFQLEGLPLGDIIVDVTREGDEDGGNKMTGTVKHMTLHSDMLGDIIANVEVDAYEKDGKLIAKIAVVWLVEGTDEGETMPIDVTFNGDGDPLPASINGIEADNANAPVEYYNLQGMRVNASNLGNGIYIRRQGNETSKVIIRK